MKGGSRLDYFNHFNKFIDDNLLLNLPLCRWMFTWHKINLCHDKSVNVLKTRSVIDPNGSLVNYQTTRSLIELHDKTGLNQMTRSYNPFFNKPKLIVLTIKSVPRST